MSETLKEKNYALVEKVVTSPWWEPKYAELLDPNMTLELPFAPPRYVSEFGTRTAVGPQDLDDKDRP